MSATKKEIGKWLVKAKERKILVKYVIIACDSFDYTDFPVECYGKSHLHDKIEHIRENGDKIMEIYDLSLSIKKQLDERKAWHV